MSVPLLDDNHLVRQYIGPLALLEHNTLQDEFKDDFIGVYHDGTTYMEEAHDRGGRGGMGEGVGRLVLV